MVQVPGYRGLDGNETTDKLAKQHYSHPLTGPEPATGISTQTTRGVKRDWMSKKHEDYLQSTHGQRQVKGFLKTPSAKKGGELFNLNRNQLRILTVLLTGHCHLKGHKLELAASLQCGRGKHTFEMA
jgi:hypothetical protein